MMHSSQVENLHERSLSASRAQVGSLIDQLASPDDRLWPSERWPAMQFDRALSEGAVGGHGPVRYFVDTYSPAERIVFRFTSPKGFDGTHGFEVITDGPQVGLRHFVRMRLRGAAKLTWPTVFRPLHDALIEDALDKAEASLGGAPVPHRWPLRVRLLRRALRRI